MSLKSLKRAATASMLALVVAFNGAACSVLDKPKYPSSTMGDGTVFVNSFFFAAPEDASSAGTWKDAMATCESSKAYGQNTWRLPDASELDALFEYREKESLAGTFNQTGASPYGWYWSTAHGTQDFGSIKRFSDGKRLYNFKDNDFSVRCVRSNK